MLFKIRKERRTEMATGLFATIDGHVTAKRVQRLFSDTKRAPAARSADHARTSEIFNHARDCSIHLAWRHDEIADHPSFGTVALETSAHQDCLPCGPGTDKTRQAEIRRPRDDALLARRQRQIGIASSNHVIHREQVLAAATNREHVNARDPGLLVRSTVYFVRIYFRNREATQHFVDDAHVAADVPEIRYLAAIEMRKIDARGKN